MNSLRSQTLKQIFNVQNVTLTLDAIVMEDVAEELNSLAQRLGWKYSMEGLQQITRVIGSLELLGNPSSFLTDIRGGVKTFFREPRRGTLKGVVKGTGGLVGGVAGGAVGTAFNMVAAGNKGFMTMYTTFSGDAQFTHKMRLQQQQTCDCSLQGRQMSRRRQRRS